MPRLYIISGEVSGDLHGSKIVSALKKKSKNLEFRGMGGSHLKNQGVPLVHDISGSSTMGFLDVLKKLGSFKRLIKLVKQDILSFNPTAVLLIDYGGFNLRMAKFCSENGIPVHYFILPKVWAWNEKRVKKIQKHVNHAYVIFPFEQEYFNQNNVPTMYVGNPVEEHIQTYRASNDKPSPELNQIALLPGSRPQEIKRILPTLLEWTQKHTHLNFTIAVPGSLKELVLSFDRGNHVRVVFDNTYEVVDSCQGAVVTSGTANLEVALLGTPLIVVYKADPISYLLAKQFVKINYISPVNLIVNRAMVPELIQSEFCIARLDKELEKMLDPLAQNKANENQKELLDVLGKNTYSETVAQLIKNELESI